MLWWCLGFLLALFLNAVVGAAVLAAVDHEDQRLLKWYQAAPSPLLSVCVLTAWPYVAWKFRKDNAKDFDGSHD